MIRTLSIQPSEKYFKGGDAKVAFSVDGILKKILPGYDEATYKVSGAVLRAAKAGLSVAVGMLLAAATAGTLFPVGFSPLVVLAVTMGLQGIDKFIREWNVEKEEKPLESNPEPEPKSLTDNPSGK